MHFGPSGPHSGDDILHGGRNSNSSHLHGVAVGGGLKVPEAIQWQPYDMLQAAGYDAESVSVD